MGKRITKGIFLKVCLFAFSVAGLMFFLPPMIYGIVHTGTVLGTIIFTVLILCILFSRQLFSAVKFLLGRKLTRIFVMAVAVVFSVGVIFAAYIFTNIILSPLCDKADGTENAVIVLGCKVNGENPSLMLRRRIEAAYEYHTKHPTVTIIASGGQGNDEDISEAECIRRELVEMGVPETLIITENKSTNTYENIDFSLKFLDAANLEPRVAIVTDGFHQYRTELIASDFGAERYSVAAKTPLYLLPSYTLREIFAVAERIVFG
ncbi:MAG: YdcF family protein [Ruminococcus sp.]|nr:YdcF family protein [Ruminococcus sp.]